jgi:hypothetical protein
MTIKRIQSARDALFAALEAFVPSEHIEGVVQAVEELAEAHAEEQSDRDNNRGDYYRWD